MAETGRHVNAAGLIEFYLFHLTAFTQPELPFTTQIARIVRVVSHENEYFGVIMFMRAVILVIGKQCRIGNYPAILDF